MYFVPESLANHPISPNLDLSFDNPLARQMFMLHNTLGEAYPPNCTVGYDHASEWIMDSGCTNHMTKSHITLLTLVKARYWV